MHLLSRNKQKPITVTPEGSLQGRKPRKAERELNTSAFICPLCLAFEDHVFTAQFRFFHTQIGRKNFCPQNMIDVLKRMTFNGRWGLFLLGFICDIHFLTFLGTSSGSISEGPLCATHCPPPLPEPSRKCCWEDME